LEPNAAVFMVVFPVDTVTCANGVCCGDATAVGTVDCGVDGLESSWLIILLIVVMSDMRQPAMASNYRDREEHCDR